MPRKNDAPLERIPQIRLYEGDKARLERLYPSLGYNRAIRELVRRHIVERENQLSRGYNKVEVDLNDDELTT